MGASLKPGEGSVGRRTRRARRAPMSEINVTPFVDVMLVLLVIFMVTAPLLTAGVPLDLPSAKGKDLATPAKPPLTVSVNKKGEVYIQDTRVDLDKLPAQLEAIGKSRGKGREDPVFVRGDKGVEYEKVIRVLSTLKAAGFNKVSLVTSPEGKG